MEGVQPLKIDRTKLKTVANYAIMISKTTTRVYQMIDEGKLTVTEIDGVQFVDIT